MDLTVKEHIARLEARHRELNARIMETGSLDKRNRLEAEIRACSLALAHYRAALKIEENFLTE
ncbi:MAG TPA: hypothetical protein VFB28_10270 [Terriglobales bacterium]|jgi:hypothetical protein|nr:hypothetical protein [Terriglobales bacterium]